MATDLTKLKCRDCMRLFYCGWWEQPTCETTGFPVDPNGPACISILPKLSARERRECLTK